MFKKFISFLWETFKIVVLALIIVVPIRYFLFQPFIVRGDSMIPNFENSDYLLIDELSFRIRPPQRGETVVFMPPNHNSFPYIKRIIGLPGETIKIAESKVIIIKNGENLILDESEYLPETSKTTGQVEVVLKENEYFVLGDNREFSSDSRIFGIVPFANITGRVFFRAWPLNRISMIEIPKY